MVLKQRSTLGILSDRNQNRDTGATVTTTQGYNNGLLEIPLSTLRCRCPKWEKAKSGRTTIINKISTMEYGFVASCDQPYSRGATTSISIILYLPERVFNVNVSVQGNGTQVQY